MGFVAPTQSRISVCFDSEWTKVVVPALSSWHAVIFSIVWLAGWTLGVSSMVRSLIDGSYEAPTIVMVAMTLFFAAFGFLGLYGLVWSLGGREIIWVNESRIARSWGVGPVQMTSEFDRSAIQKAFWLLLPNGEGKPTERGPVKISYGGKDVSLASGLDKTEAQTILDTLTQVAGIPQT